MPKNSPTKYERRKTNMIKIDARSIAEQMNIHTKDAETFLTTFTDIVGDSLASGEPVRLSGFAPLTSYTLQHMRRGSQRSANLSKTRPLLLLSLWFRRDKVGPRIYFYVWLVFIAYLLLMGYYKWLFWAGYL
jgi:nucleoid DNA-binding protein